MQEKKNTNIVWQDTLVESGQRQAVVQQKGCVLWFTGLSGSGKTTIAQRFEKRLIDQGRLAYLLDGDNIRYGLNRDLGFSPEDRQENIRRIAEVGRLFADCGVICLTAFISPLISMRRMAQEIIGSDNFIEVAVVAPLDVCEQRDPKGLYARARAGAISEFTGISAPYELPLSPHLVLNTAECAINDCVDRLLAYLKEHGYLSPQGAD